jgi:Rieske Fe-S protein
MDRFTRRSVMRACGVAGGAAVIGSCSQGSETSTNASKRGSQPGAPTTADTPLAKVGALSGAPTPTVDPVTGIDAFLIKHGAAVSMLSAVCSHMGCSVAWVDAKREFVCPCHHAVYDVSGDVVSGPAPKPLQSLAVEVRDGSVYRRE